MTRHTFVRVCVVSALVLFGVFAFWRTREGPDERAIRQRLEALRAEVNASTMDGAGTAAPRPPKRRPSEPRRSRTPK